MCSSLGDKFTCFIMETDQSVQSDIEEKKHRFCRKSLIHRSHVNSARCVQSSPSNVKAGGLSPRRRKEPNMLLKTVTEVNWKCQPLSRRQNLRPKKCHCLLRQKKSSPVPSTSAADKSTPDRSQPKTVEIQCHLQLKVLWRLQLPLSLQKQATLISKKAFHPFN